jgi:hypothetical protein
MKRRSLFYILGAYVMGSLLLASVMVGCSDDEEEQEREPEYLIDCNPYAVLIKLVDTNNVDLFDEEFENNLLNCEYKMGYDGETYNVTQVSYANGVKSRYFLPTFEGLYFVNDDIAKRYLVGKLESSKTKYTLSFGEFDRMDTLNLSLDFYVPWREEPYKITAYHMLRHDGGINYTNIDTLRLDGVVQPANPITIVVPNDELSVQ